MDVLGFWKVKQALMFNENDDETWRDAEAVLSDDPDEDVKQMLAARFLFDEDGFLKVIVPLPEGVSQEEVDRAVAAGKLHLYGEDSMIIEKHPWKSEGGKALVGTSFGGETEWDELKEVDGMVGFLMYRLVRERGRRHDDN